MLEELIEVLEMSVKKNGEKPLTNKWLLNICKKANEEKWYTAEQLAEFEREENLWKD